MAQVVIYRTDQAALGVTVPGINMPNESWDILEGGERTVEGLVVNPGGGLPQRALGGIAKRGPATIKKLWTPTIFLVFRELEEGAGFTPIVITYSVKLNVNAPAVFADTYTGIIGNVERPPYDADKSEKAYLTVTCDLDGDSQIQVT
jgi:hypothetical protein